MSLLLADKHVFVTGGTRGIGAAICDVFAREGADVAFTYAQRDDLADRVRTRVAAHGRRAVAHKVSVSDRAKMSGIVRDVVRDWGHIDVLVNNAAVSRGDRFATMSEAAWDEVIGTNVGSLYAVTKPVYRHMIRRRRGAILNITSIAALRSLPTAVHYATSKAAVVGFTKCLSREAAAFGVRVNAIAAGLFDTELGRALPAQLLEIHATWAPLGRLGRPHELAEVAAFVVSDRNSFMNGEVVMVDGGVVT